MFGMFLHCTAVLNCDRATHGLPADRAPVYRGCPCRDPGRMVSGTKRQPSRCCSAAATAETAATAACVLHACARAINIHWTSFHKHTTSVKCTLTWISTDLACTVMHRTSPI